MFSLLSHYSCCFTHPRTDSEIPIPNTEKSSLLTYTNENPPTYHRTQTDLVTDVIETLYSSNNTTTTIQDDLNSIVHEAKWFDKRSLAEAILAALERALHTGKKMNVVMHTAYNKAVVEARKIQTEHPILTATFLTIVAIGVLYLVWPAVLTALGFGEEGIVLGSFAARWQSLYPDVPIGSVFAFLQRLGMTLKFEL